MLSPNVPVFRDDRGIELDVPWLVSFLTCAAPYAPSVGHPRSGDLFEQRIARVLSIAQAYGYSELVLGAWCAAHSATMLGARPVTSAARSSGNSQVCLVKWLLRSPIGLPSDVSLDRFVMRSRIE